MLQHMVGILVLLCALQPSSVQAESAPKPQNIAFVCAGLPWMYGPYQAQGNGLMKELHDTHGFNTFWMMRGSHAHGIPSGTYTAKEMDKLTPVNLPRLPKDWDSAHLTLIGLPPRSELSKVTQQVRGVPVIAMSEFNAAAKLYGIDAFILLGDITSVYFDVYDFDVPVVAWVPFHFKDVRGSNLALVKRYAHIAGLTPSTTRLINDVRSGVTYIPHFIETAVLEASATQWLAGLRKKKRSSAKTDRELVFDAAKYDVMFKRRAADFAAVEGGDEEEPVFLVLASGTNYEGADRKGWDVAIQAFAMFHQKHPEIKKHLWVHSFSSTEILSDIDGKGAQAPPELQAQGVNLRHLVQEMDLDPELYTMDINLHPRGRVAAMKTFADVCLHPSKVEGFGMQVLECQSLGTPVVTTKFNAMKDFTKNGISVEPAQWEHYGTLDGKWALPDVKGTAEALYQLAIARATPDAKKKSQEGVDWIKDEFSLRSVGNRWNDVLQVAADDHAKAIPEMLSKMPAPPAFAERPIFHVTNDIHPRVVNWTEEWTLFHRPDVSVDYEMVQKMLWTLSLKETVVVAFLVCKDERGLPIEVQVREQDFDGIHRINTAHPVLLPTWSYAQAQHNFAYIHSTAWMLAGNSQAFVKILPPGPAHVIGSDGSPKSKRSKNPKNPKNSKNSKNSKHGPTDEL